MPRYKMEDGTIINTSKAQRSWEELLRFDGQNRISCATGSQWEHETLYKSSKGRYYIVRTSQWEGTTHQIKLATPEEATGWLLLNEHQLPEDLREYEDKIVE